MGIVDYVIVYFYGRTTLWNRYLRHQAKGKEIARIKHPTCLVTFCVLLSWFQQMNYSLYHTGIILFIYSMMKSGPSRWWVLDPLSNPVSKESLAYDCPTWRNGNHWQHYRPSTFLHTINWHCQVQIKMLKQRIVTPQLSFSHCVYKW